MSGISQKEVQQLCSLNLNFFINTKFFSGSIELEISRGFPGAFTQNEEYFSSEGNPQSDKFWLIPTLLIRYTF